MFEIMLAGAFTAGAYKVIKNNYNKKLKKRYFQRRYQ
jgi:hypothetical protein